jgi:alpha-glucosidase
MLRLIENGFEVIYKGLTLIKHDLLNPAFFIGDKSLSIEMENGEFQFNDQTVFKPVTNFSVRDNIVDFKDFKIIIDTNEDNYLKIKFEDLDKPLRFNLVAENEEAVFGMGEHFTTLDLRGNVVRNWVEEHITRKQIYSKIIRRIFKIKPKKWNFEEYKTYFVTPTFVSSRLYFCHVNTCGYGNFDFSAQAFHRISIYSSLEEIVFGQENSYLELSGQLSKLLGHLPKLPEWIYDGMIFAIQGGTEIVDNKIKLLKEKGARINGVWSQDWCGELYTFFGKQVFWNWELDNELYPDLTDKIKEWSKEDIKFLAYINPYLNAFGRLFSEAKELSYLVKNLDGTPFLTKATSFDFGIIDITNPDAYSWFKAIIKKNYLDKGIMGWMADFGEYLPTHCLLHSGNPEELHNKWPDLWVKLNREVLEEANMLSAAIFFNRAGYKDNCKYSTLIWNGDQHVDFTDDFGMASALRAKLSLAFSGVGFSHSDIGGYTTVPAIKRSKELYIRWLQMNTFTPVMRSHEGNKPWKNKQFDSDQELLDFNVLYTNIHYLLKPYFLAVEYEYHDFGYPMIRPIMFHYDYFTDQAFMLGQDLLVYPILKSKQKHLGVFIPKGTWKNLFTGEEFKEGKYKIKSNIWEIPVFYNCESKHQSIFEKVTEYIVNNKKRA